MGTDSDGRDASAKGPAVGNPLQRGEASVTSGGSPPTTLTPPPGTPPSPPDEARKDRLHNFLLTIVGLLAAALLFVAGVLFNRYDKDIEKLGNRVGGLEERTKLVPPAIAFLREEEERTFKANCEKDSGTFDEQSGLCTKPNGVSWSYVSKFPQE